MMRSVSMKIVAYVAYYFAASVASSTVFTAWMALNEFSGSMGQQLGLINMTGEALRDWPYILVMALLLMFLPCCLMMWVSRWSPFRGPIYCASGTAVAALFAFGGLGAIFPARGHPTALEGFVLAIETSGFPIFVSGAVGGLVYWLCRERDARLKRSVKRDGTDDVMSHRA